MTAPLLSVSGLAASVSGAERLADVAFDVPRGACVGMVGETGCGKTLTCRILTGVHRRAGIAVTRGRALFDGADLATLGEDGWRRVRGRRIALVPQASMNGLDPLMRVGRQLEEAVRALDPAARPRDRALELLEQVAMPRPAEVLRRFPHELSGGMRQRALIALALAGRPELLVADEPTTALDVTVQRRILELLDSLRRATGMAILLVTHDLEVVRAVAERVVVMYEGRTVERGPAGAVLDAPEHPYTRALLAAQPARLAVAPRRPARNGTPILRADGAGVRYRSGSEAALSGASLAVGPGAAIGIVGESGSGKTTLARLLAGVLEPTSGTVTVDGAPWSAVRRRRDPARRRVQLVFQDPYGSLNPWRTAHAAVAEAIRAGGDASRSQAAERARELLASVGLSADAIGRTPRRLSGGQCQRVGIARALAAEPAVLIADEPTSALDVSVQAQILELLARLREERGLAIVLVSHDLAVVRRVADVTVVMHRGRIVEHGPTDRVYDAPAHPYTRELIGASS